MKSIFKILIWYFLILVSPKLLARDIILIENQATQAEGVLLKSILIKRFNLPQELITLKNINSHCEIKTEAIIHLCLVANGELMIKKINQFVVKNSLGVFLNQKNEIGAEE